MIQSLLPTDRWTRFLLVPAVVFIATISDRNYQTDLWHHLARGRAIVAEGRLLDEERFTYTMHGQPIKDVNWVWQVLFYRLHALGGLSLVQTVNSAILAVMMGLLVLLAWRRCGSLIAASAVCLLAFFGLWQLLIIRPQTMSLLLFVLLYSILEEASERPCLLVLTLPIMAMWVNVHGGFAIGLVLIGSYVVGCTLERVGNNPSHKGRVACCWFLCFVAALTATLANPYGWRVYEYVRQTSKMASGRSIDEWLPPSFTTLTGIIWGMSLVLLVICLAFSRRRPRVREVVLLCCFLPLACGSVRMVAWWLLICTPILAAQVTELWPRLRQLEDGEDRPSVGNVLACGVLVLVMFVSLPWLEKYHPIMSRPERAHRTETDLQGLADHLRLTGDGGRIFTRFAWGEYLGWRLAPDFTVFMDGRIEIIPDAIWGQYGDITRGHADWEHILAYYGVDYLLLDKSGYHHELLPLVVQSSEWRQMDQRGDAVLFVRARGLCGSQALKPHCVLSP